MMKSGSVVFAAVTGFLSLALLGQPGAPQEADLHVFCPSRSTGQFCVHGTIAVLGLSGEKKAGWERAARRYNEAVEAATRQLLDEAGQFLSEEELDRVEAWLSKGLNPELNRLLSQRAPAK